MQRSTTAGTGLLSFYRCQAVAMLAMAHLVKPRSINIILAAFRTRSPHTPLWAGLAFALLTLALSTPMRATADDCAHNAGSALCTAFTVSPWVIGLCDDMPAYTQRSATWCSVLGGTWRGSDQPCEGMDPFLEDGELYPYAEDFERRIHNVQNCQFNGQDKGWLSAGQTITSSNCWSGGQVVTTGIEVSNLREMPFSGQGMTTSGCSATTWKERVIAQRIRGFACPANYTRQTFITSTGTYRYCRLPPDLPDPSKNGGCSKAGYGNPCDAALGNKYQQESDYASANPYVPGFTRRFNSLGQPAPGRPVARALVNWSHNYDRRIYLAQTVYMPTAFVTREDGKEYHFVAVGDQWVGDPDVADALSRTETGWTYTMPDGTVETYESVPDGVGTSIGRLRSITDTRGLTQALTYDANGRLQMVTGAFGHSLSFVYDGAGRLARLITPDGEIRYSYDGNNSLAKVTYPDNTAKLYHHENASFPRYLTGISHVDAAGVATRYSTYAYDAAGKAIKTEHATTTNGAPQETFTLTYDSDTQTTVTDAAGNQEKLTFAVNLGVKNLVAKTNLGDNKTLTQTFDARNNLTCKKDEEGRVTTYTYNAANQKLSETVGQTGGCANPVNTPATRTTTYQYISTELNLPTLIASPSVYAGATKQTAIAYDANRNPLTITQSGYVPDGTAVSRTVTMSYNAQGQVTAIDGPRTDVSDITTLAYHDCTSGGACGQLQSVTNALGHVTTYDSYDAAGRLTQSTDANGLKTAYAYDLRGRVLAVTVIPPTGATRQTQYTYDAAGNVTQVITPDGITLTYTYDAAQDLRSVTDNLGNKVAYTYDRKGNRATEKTYDPDGTLVRSIETTYDLRDRIAAINAGGSITAQVRDAVGNLTQEIDPNNADKATPDKTTHGYDALNRLLQTIDRLAGITAYAYDVNDRLTQVAAPNGATTRYEVDDLGNVLKEISPDRGTRTYTYDAAGNLKTLTDARNITVAYRYDALNRVSAIDYPGTAEDVHLTYDSATGCAFGQGRLCRVTDESGTTAYAYDAFGNVAEHQKTELGVTYVTKYTYDAGNRIATLTYPDGRLVSYNRDTLGRITTITQTHNGTTITLTSNRSYRADGLLTGQTYGNGLNEARSYDLQGRLTEQMIGSQLYTYTYDLNGNLVGKSKVGTSASMAHKYDLLDRVSSTHLPPQFGGYWHDYTYDANGNRTLDGGYWRWNYDPQTNRLVSSGFANESTTYPIPLDAAGNHLDWGTYNQAGRLSVYDDVSFGPAAATYVYNYRGLRTRKTLAVPDLCWLCPPIGIFHYDLEGNLIAETTDNGTVVRAYIWADGVPIAQFDSITNGVNVLTYLHTDHMGSTRLGTNAAGAAVWEWGWESPDAFGYNSLPDEDVDRDRVITIINFRFPGHYFDAESYLHYNWNRYYYPVFGRYITSDPIGIDGGLNTYVYVENNPLRYVDPTGLVTWTGTVSTIGVVYGGGGMRFVFELTSECINGKRAKVRVVAGGFAVGAGNTAGATKSNIKFEDDTSRPDPWIFHGVAYYTGIGHAFIGIGYSANAFKLGGATSIGHGHQVGWDASVYGGAGDSRVDDYVIEDCCTNCCRKALIQ